MATYNLDTAHDADGEWHYYMEGVSSSSTEGNTFIGDERNNVVIDAAGNSSITGAAGNDQLYGGKGNDTLDGGGDTSGDILSGDNGDDLLIGGSGALDTYLLEFGPGIFGHDTIMDDTGNLDIGEEVFVAGPPIRYSGTLSGEAQHVSGNYWKLVHVYPKEGGNVTQTIYMEWNGEGSDLTFWSNLADRSVSSVTIKDFHNGAFHLTLAPKASGGGSTPTPQPDVTDATPGDDDLTGTSEGDRILGLAGNDTLTGGAGADTINGNLGADYVHGNTGDDSVRGGKDNDTVLGGNGNDSVYGDFALDSVVGGAGNDLMHGGKEADTLIGGDGADTLFGDLGNDVLNGGAGADVFVFVDGSGTDSIQGFANDDLLRFSANINGGTVDTFEELSAHITTGSDTVIDLGGGSSLTLVGVTSLTSADVEFV